jgi:tight adherence protein C
MPALLIMLIFATALSAIWIFLMNTVKREDWIAAAYNKTLENLAEIAKLQLKSAENEKKLENYHGVSLSVMKIFIKKNYEKEIGKFEKQNDFLKKGNLKNLSIFVIPGYVLQKKFETINQSGLHKKIFNLYAEIYGRKYAEARTAGIFAKMFSYGIIGAAASFILGILIIAFGDFMTGVAVSGIGTAIVATLIYSMYDSLRAQSIKRRTGISKQFPGVVSKLALLVTSGMIMDKAWKETAYSQELELYKEMQKTSEELENLVTPENAYGGFIKRCNTKETAKLASAVIQNLSKSNAEIGFLLKAMAKEAWAERRHAAKREAEKANSKLLIPTMLLFLAILIMIMVPVAMNFSGGLF